MTRAIILGPMGLGSAPAWACSPCRQAVIDAVYNPQFAGNLLVLLLPFAVLLPLVAGAHFLADGITARPRPSGERR